MPQKRNHLAAGLSRKVISNLQCPGPPSSGTDSVFVCFFSLHAHKLHAAEDPARHIYNMFVFVFLFHIWTKLKKFNFLFVEPSCVATVGVWFYTTRQ